MYLDRFLLLSRKQTADLDVRFFWVPPIISGTGKATDYKFGGYIYRVNLNKNLFKIFEKRERGRIQGLSKFLGYPLLSDKATDFKFCRNIQRVDPNKSP